MNIVKKVLSFIKKSSKLRFLEHAIIIYTIVYYLKEFAKKYPHLSKRIIR